MGRKGLLVAAAVVVASTLTTLVLVALNRMGEPEAVLELTERELRLPARQVENTALVLSLAWDRPRDTPRQPVSQPGLFDRARLESIGFDCRLPVTRANARHYRMMPPRTTYAALEYEGDAWRARMAEPLPPPEDPPTVRERPVVPPESAAQTEQDPETSRLREPHLVVVDVGNDPARLRARYPNRRRVVVVPATVSLMFVQAGSGGTPPFLTGMVTQILPDEINVPREHRAILERLQAEQSTNPWTLLPHEPRYCVTVKWGRRLQPWIADVQPISSAVTR
jgi:hypothetical protein